MGGKKCLALADLNQFRGLRRNEFFTLTVPLHERIHLVVQTHEVVQTKIHTELAGKRVEDQSIGLRARGNCLAEGAQTTFPVDEGSVLFQRRCDRQDHICAIGHLTATNLEAHQEINLIKRLSRGSRIIKVTKINATDNKRLKATISCGFQHLRGIKTALSGNLSPCQRLASLLRGKRTAERQKTGKKTGFHSTALTGAARDPLNTAVSALCQSNDFTEQTRSTACTLADQDHSPVKTRGEIGELTTFTDLGGNLNLGTGSATQQLSRELGEASGSHGSQRSNAELALASGLAHPQEDRTTLILGLEPNQENLAGALKLRVSDAQSAACDVGSKE